MRSNESIMIRWAALLALVLAAAVLAPGPFAPGHVEAASYVVTRTTDRSPVGCQQEHQGGCTLREAILGANNGSAAATITFHIQSATVPVISIGGGGLGPLPALTTRVVIDGTTQTAGYVRIRWAGTEPGVDAFRVMAGDSTIKGLAIYQFPGDGVEILGPGGNTIANNYIGTPDGIAGETNANGGHGVFVNGSQDNTVGPGNVISNNGGDGVRIGGTVGASSGNAVAGNFIGTGHTGASGLGNAGHGVAAVESAGNTIGGTDAASRNLISGNALSGVFISGATSASNIILGNNIGTNAAGVGPIPNGQDGVAIVDAPGNTIGGADAASRNLISGNVLSGVSLSGATSASNIVLGNHIGMNAAGGGAIPNGRDGVAIVDAPGNTIGGEDEGARNIISGNAGIGVSVLGASAAGNVVRGNYIGADANGLVAPGNGTEGVSVSGAANAAIAGNLISGNGGAGVHIQSGSTIAIVTGNLIGTDKDGVTDRGNGGRGVWIDAASGNLIGYGVDPARNVISGNAGAGVEISASGADEHADNNYVINNYIGVNGAGSSALGNSGPGVILAVPGSAATASGNIVGDEGSGNVISGNGMDGVTIDGAGAGGNTVSSNLIGTDVSGTAGVGNGEVGVRVTGAAGNTIHSNVITDHSAGVRISGATASGNVLLGNYIGTNAIGAADLGNADEGIFIESAPGNNIGGAPTAPSQAGAGAGNVISGNGGNGVWIEGPDATGNTVSQNYIGTNTAGVVLGNGGHGVLAHDVTGVDIGGEADGAGNVIAYNGGDGVSVEGSSGDVAVRRNDIFDNGGLGIDLAPGGVTGNDAGDADMGANGLQNTPVLTLAENPGAHIVGGLDTVPGAPFRIEFFSSSTCDASGSGEGQRFIGSTTVITDGAGHAPVEVTFPAHVYTGDVVTATATDVAGNTSEFSPCVTATGPIVPTPTPVGQTPSPSPTPTPTPVATPTPTPVPERNGDVDCDDDADALDALGILRHVAGLPPLAVPDGCPGIGANHDGRLFGDVDCGAAVDTVDSLRILRHAAGLPPLAAPPGCPVVGT